MREKESLPGIYEAEGKHCFICSTESKHYGFGKGTFSLISEIPQYKKLPVPKRNLFIDKSNLVIKHRPQNLGLLRFASQPCYLCDFGQVA